MLNSIDLYLTSQLAKRAGRGGILELLRKAVIPAAGLGTRLLSATKEQPKEMLPVFSKAKNGELCIKPVVQLVFEQLYSSGFREFCFVVGREKRAIEDHFTPDYHYVSMLQDKGRNGPSEDLQSFYDMIEESTLVWVNQPEPRGFGDAVLKAKSFVGGDSFLVHAGDSYIFSDELKHLKMLMQTSVLSKSDATFLVQHMSDPRHYGVVEGLNDNGIVHVTRVVEKPKKPMSNLAIKPVYIFNSVILRALEITKTGFGGEIQLTDGIQKMIDWGLTVRGLELDKNSPILDIGSPELYWEAQNISYDYSSSLSQAKKRIVGSVEPVEIPITSN